MPASGKPPHALRHGERGQVLPLVVGGSAALIILAALGTTVGYWRYEQQLAQTAADSGALAAAIAVQNKDPRYYDAANADTTANGFAGSPKGSGVLDTKDGVTVTVHWPPASGPSKGDPQHVEVLVKKKLGVFFTAKTTTIQTRAVALIPQSGACLYALSNESTVGPVISAFVLNSPAVLKMPNCKMYDNGTMYANGGTIDAGYVGVAGAVSNNPAPTYLHASETGMGPVADPCGKSAGCTFLKTNPPSDTVCDYPGQMVFTTVSPGTPVQVPAGTYCGQVVFQSTVQGSGGTIALVPGASGSTLFNFVQGFTVHPNVEITGKGVTIYSKAGAILPTSGGIDVSAPTSGSTAGVAIFQATSPPNSSAQLSFNGCGVLNIQGLIYAPETDIYFDSNVGSLQEVIGSRVIVNAGNGGSTLTFTPSGAGQVELSE